MSSTANSERQKLPGTYKAFVSRFPELGAAHESVARAVQAAGGGLELLETKGSGDVAGAALSDGVVELPPRATGVGPWPLYRWDTP